VLRHVGCPLSMHPPTVRFAQNQNKISGLSPLKRLGGTAFSLVFLAGGILALWGMSLGPGWDWVRARSWVQAPAVIESAELERGRDSDGDAVYSVAVRFSYEFKRYSLTGTKFGFRKGKTNVGVNGMRHAVNSLKSNPQTTCWVNPEAPAEAVLDRSLPGGFFTGILFSLPFLTVGIAGSFWMLAGPPSMAAFRARRNRQLAGLIRDGELTWPGGDPVDAFSAGDRAVIFSRDSALASAGALTGLNLFWNGIVGVFISIVVAEWIGGKHEWFLMLFLTPFVVIGSLMLYGAAQAWRSVFCTGFVAVVSPLPGFGGCAVQVSLAVLPADPLLSSQPLEARLAAMAIPDRQGKPGTSMPASIGFRAGGFRDVAARDTPQKKEHILAAVDIPAGTGAATIRLPGVPPPLSAKPGLRWWRSWQLQIKDERNRVRSFEISKDPVT
ncbi:MAG: DUF3592 domain-containing protein, partial [Verrucomicrobiota bacterium]